AGNREGGTGEAAADGGEDPADPGQFRGGVVGFVCFGSSDRVRWEIFMADKIVRSAIFAIPDDPEASTYRFIIVAAKRARQLQSGARSFLPTTSRKPTVTSMEEVRRGLVKYTDIPLLPGASLLPEH